MQSTLVKKQLLTSIESVVHQYWCILTLRDPIMQSYESLMGNLLIQYWILDSQLANGLLKKSQSAFTFIWTERVI